MSSSRIFIIVGFFFRNQTTSYLHYYACWMHNSAYIFLQTQPNYLRINADLMCFDEKW